MKTRIITLCLLLITFTGINVSYAAFPVKQPAAVTATTAENTDATEVATAAAESTTTASDATTTVKAKHMGFFHKIKTMIYPDVVAGGGGPGWPGILALVFGILALGAFSAVGFLLFSIGAVVFGAIGIGHGYSLRLLAAIGLVLGIVALLALL